MTGSCRVLQEVAVFVVDRHPETYLAQTKDYWEILTAEVSPKQYWLLLPLFPQRILPGTYSFWDIVD